MKATYVKSENFDTRRKLANRVLKAMRDLTELDNGTIRNPVELASSRMDDGRTLIETIYEDGEVAYNDTIYIVEVNDCYIYVDMTVSALLKAGKTSIEYISDIEDDIDSNCISCESPAFYQ